jgi:hypothetical protein
MEEKMKGVNTNESILSEGGDARAGASMENSAPYSVNEGW